MTNDIRYYIDLITEVERQEHHKDMQVRGMMTKPFKLQLKRLAANDDKIAGRITKAIKEILSYYSWNISSLPSKFKKSGDSGKSKNYTQIDNNVYHYHIGGSGRTTKDGKEVSNEMLEFQVIELPDNNGNLHLVVLFFSFSTHGRGRWNIDGIIELSNIDQLSDLHGIADRIKFA